MAKWKVLTEKESRDSVMSVVSSGPRYIKKSVIGAYTCNADNLIRILPPKATDPDMGSWFLPFRAYYLEGQSFVSPKMFNKGAHDPVYAMYNKLRSVKLEEEIRDIKGTDRMFLFVLDLNSKNINTPLAWAAPPSVIREICELCIDGHGGQVTDPSHPTEGREIYFKKTGEKFKTRYTRIDFKKVHALKESTADMMPHVRDVIDIPDDSLLEQMVSNYNYDVNHTPDVEDESEIRNVLNQNKSAAEPDAQESPAEEVSDAAQVVSVDDDEDEDEEYLQRQMAKLSAKWEKKQQEKKDA